MEEDGNELHRFYSEELLFSFFLPIWGIVCSSYFQRINVE